MQSSQLELNGDAIHYSYGGNGNKLLICFHGYGETADSYQFLEKYIHKSYTIVAIDMPFHGETKWSNSKPFTPDDLKYLLSSLKEKHGFNNMNFSLMGFSMGGRIALTALQELPSQIDKLILLAPDGLKINFWYWLSTQTWLGNKIFAATINFPYPFLWFLNICNKLKLINQSVYKFVHHFLDDKQIRKLLYLRWTCFRKLKPDLEKIKSLIREDHIAVHLLYGKHDRIILSNRGVSFRKDIEAWCSVEVLNCGHQVLHEKNIQAILKYLTS